jgi:hypothetical protein
MMQPATTEGIVEVLGDVDTFTIERILDTHATVAEISEALAHLEDERRFGERHEPTSSRVAEVREILEEMVEDCDEDGYVS